MLNQGMQILPRRGRWQAEGLTEGDCSFSGHAPSGASLHLPLKGRIA